MARDQAPRRWHRGDGTAEHLGARITSQFTYCRCEERPRTRPIWLHPAVRPYSGDSGRYDHVTLYDEHSRPPVDALKHCRYSRHPVGFYRVAGLQQLFVAFEVPEEL